MGNPLHLPSVEGNPGRSRRFLGIEKTHVRVADEVVRSGAKGIGAGYVKRLQVPRERPTGPCC